MHHEVQKKTAGVDSSPLQHATRASSSYVVTATHLVRVASYVGGGVGPCRDLALSIFTVYIHACMYGGFPARSYVYQNRTQPCMQHYVLAITLKRYKIYTHLVPRPMHAFGYIRRAAAAAVS